MLQLRNETPFAASMAVFPDLSGADTLFTIVRATFSIAGSLAAVAEQQRPVQAADEYRGDPARTSLTRPSDMHLAKPSTDILLQGDAWAPRGRRAPEVDVTLSVGPVRKTVRVFGDREWKNGGPASPTAPVPFDRIPLVYERAFGGVLEVGEDGKPTAVDARNAAGMGPSRQGKQGTFVSRKLPNIEDPAHLIKSPTDAPTPAGFGPVAPSWEPRRSRAGTYDEAWRKTRAPYLPADFDPRFFQVAPPELVSRAYLQGGEPVAVQNASPAGAFHFRVPVCTFDLEIHVAGQVERPPLHLETVAIDMGESLLTLIFRAALGCDKRVLKVQRVRIGMQKLDPSGRER